jgi:transcriptional regulator GlxA family with amidase domain
MFIECRNCIAQSSNTCLIWYRATPPPVNAMVTKADRSHALVTKVLSILETQDEETFTLSELCRVAGVSERALNYAFHEEFNLSPARYLKIQRLKGAHGDLSRADLADMTIAEIANKWDFWHMGQFAKDFNALFGMLPSDVRKRLMRKLSRS